MKTITSIVALAVGLGLMSGTALGAAYITPGLGSGQVADRNLSGMVDTGDSVLLQNLGGGVYKTVSRRDLRLADRIIVRDGFVSNSELQLAGIRAAKISHTGRLVWSNSKLIAVSRIHGFNSGHTSFFKVKGTNLITAAPTGKARFGVVNTSLIGAPVLAPTPMIRTAYVPGVRTGLFTNRIGYNHFGYAGTRVVYGPRLGVYGHPYGWGARTVVYAGHPGVIVARPALAPFGTVYSPNGHFVNYSMPVFPHRTLLYSY